MLTERLGPVRGGQREDVVAEGAEGPVVRDVVGGQRAEGVVGCGQRLLAVELVQVAARDGGTTGNKGSGDCTGIGWPLRPRLTTGRPGWRPPQQRGEIESERALPCCTSAGLALQPLPSLTFVLISPCSPAKHTPIQLVCDASSVVGLSDEVLQGVPRGLHGEWGKGSRREFELARERARRDIIYTIQGGVGGRRRVLWRERGAGEGKGCKGKKWRGAGEEETKHGRIHAS